MQQLLSVGKMVVKTIGGQSVASSKSTGGDATRGLIRAHCGAHPGSILGGGTSGCAVSRCITNACWVSFTVLMEAVTTMEPAAICGAIYRSMMTSAVRFRIQVRRRRATRVYAWQQWRALKVV